MTLPQPLIASTLKQLVFLPFGQSSTPDLSVPVRLRPAARELANASNIYISTDPTGELLYECPFWRPQTQYLNFLTEPHRASDENRVTPYSHSPSHT